MWCINPYPVLEEQERGVGDDKGFGIGWEEDEDLWRQGLFQSWRLSSLVWYFAIFRYAMFLRSSPCNSMLLVDRIVMEPEAAGWTSGNWQLDIFQVSSLEKVLFSATIWGGLELWL